MAKKKAPKQDPEELLTSAQWAMIQEHIGPEVVPALEVCQLPIDNDDCKHRFMLVHRTKSQLPEVQNLRAITYPLERDSVYPLLDALKKWAAAQ